MVVRALRQRYRSRSARAVRLLVVGGPLGAGWRRRLRQSFDVVWADGVAERGGASGRFDAVLLSACHGARGLEAALAHIERAPEADRPARLVVASAGRAAQLRRALAGRVDAVLRGDTDPDAAALLIAGAVRLRAVAADLKQEAQGAARLREQLQDLAGRVARELRLAATIQRSLLPAPLRHARLDVAREFIPHRGVGGDYFDLVRLSPNRLAIAVGDVMGKGVAAALLAASLKAAVRSQLAGPESRPEQVVGRVNALFREVAPQGGFAGLFFGIFDLALRRLEFVNAGHDRPLRVDYAGEVHELFTDAPALGLVEGARYASVTVQLERGDLLVLYSDGVTDRANEDGQMFGVERLRHAAARSRSDEARIALYSILGEVQAWAGTRSPDDDLTLVAARVR
jgi:serine phosphatase RsbU (regulator of sigma subunit)